MRSARNLYTRSVRNLDTRLTRNLDDEVDHVRLGNSANSIIDHTRSAQNLVGYITSSLEPNKVKRLTSRYKTETNKSTQNLRGTSSTLEIQSIPAILLSHSLPKDSMTWRHSRSGQYTVKFANYFVMEKLISNHVLHVPGNWSLISKLNIPLRMKILLWRLLRGCLPIRQCLQSKGILCDISCEQYRRRVEKTDEKKVESVVPNRLVTKQGHWQHHRFPRRNTTSWLPWAQQASALPNELHCGEWRCLGLSPVRRGAPWPPLAASSKGGLLKRRGEGRRKWSGGWGERKGASGVGGGKGVAGFFEGSEGILFNLVKSEPNHSGALVHGIQARSEYSFLPPGKKPPPLLASQVSPKGKEDKQSEEAKNENERYENGLALTGGVGGKIEAEEALGGAGAGGAVLIGEGSGVDGGVGTAVGDVADGRASESEIAERVEIQSHLEKLHRRMEKARSLIEEEWEKPSYERDVEYILSLEDTLEQLRNECADLTAPFTSDVRQPKTL
ncbi:hypothetical protein Fmac_032422 [Flemingia macrophylla]|uniref:Reverse transcriptase zinc-binding domain-containing protein n=1 Tax=Flemingia macrophylla TaxID=520843 RepID=A0ABD1L4W4_9FABA